nr:peroxidasin [Hymenolepis microstoma]
MFKILVISAIFWQKISTLRCPPPPTSGLYACRNRSLNEVPLPIGAPIKNRLAITALDISNNFIQILHQDALRPYPALTCLRVERNRLWKITDLAFQAVQNLQRLLLRSNSLLIQPGSLSPKALLQLKHLKELDLSENPLGQLPVGFFPPSLVELRIERTLPGLIFQPGSMGAITELENLSLASNSFESLPSYLDAEIRSLKNLKKLNLEGNKWNCDCHLTWLARLGRESNITATCYKPKELNQQCIATLPLTEFQCAPIALNKKSIGNGITNVEAGSTVTMVCHFYSEPRGKIRWLRDNEGISEVIKQGVEERVIEDYLTETNLTLKETREGLEDGIYKCEAKNARGRDEIVFRLRVGYQEKEQEQGLRGYGLALTSALAVIGGALLITLILLGVLLHCSKNERTTDREAPRRIIMKEEKNSVAFTQGLQLDAPGTEEMTQFSGVVHYQPISPIANWFCTEEMNEIEQF